MNAAFDADRAWRQVQTRNASADGQFVYAVETTGIFCRPSCPSRRPSRQNVRFFANADAAMAAGYRACRRCHPAGEHAEAEPAGDVAVEALGQELRVLLGGLLECHRTGGGLAAGSSTLVLGPAGAGKSILVLQYIAAEIAGATASKAA